MKTIRKISCKLFGHRLEITDSELMVSVLFGDEIPKGTTMPVRCWRCGDVGVALWMPSGSEPLFLDGKL